MPSQSRKHRGYATQKHFAEWLRDLFPYAEPTGAGRQGKDILSTPGVWFELKARAGFDPLSALKQMEKEAVEESGGGIPIQAAVLRMNGQGPGTIDDWVVCMRASTLKELLREAGYGA